LVDGVREWVTVSDVSVNDEDFLELGKDSIKETSVTKGQIGAAQCHLFSLLEAVKFAEQAVVSFSSNSYITCPSKKSWAQLD
jgi:aminoglycoside 3-N-acetyltransferase